MINNYLKHISKHQTKLDDHAICPYVKKYLNSIWVWKTNDIETDVIKYTKNFPINKKVVILISDSHKYEYADLVRICNKYQNKKIWLAPDHPNHYNEIGGVRTNNEDYAMILIQDRDDLKKHSDILKKTTYYNFWSDDYYKEIVKDRENDNME